MHEKLDDVNESVTNHKLVIPAGADKAQVEKFANDLAELPARVQIDRAQIKELALANGFKLKEQPDGTMDLNPYVYDFVKALHVQWSYSLRYFQDAEIKAEFKSESVNEPRRGRTSTLLK